MMTRRSLFMLVVAPLLARQPLDAFTCGMRWQRLDFGAGTLVMLHGRDPITPKAQIEETVAVGTVVVTLAADGRAIAERVVPHLSGEVRRLKLTA